MLEEATAASPDDVVLKTRLARAWVERGEFDRARMHASRASEYLELADACAARGDAEGQVAMLVDARRLAPDDLSIAVRLVRACAERGDYVGGVRAPGCDRGRVSTLSSLRPPGRCGPGGTDGRGARGVRAAAGA